MSLGRDLANPKWMYAKAGLFLVVLASCSVFLLLEAPSWRAGVFLALVIWASARLYYFMFYVIERYIDPSFRFAGIGSVVRYVVRRRIRDEDESAGQPGRSRESEIPKEQ